MFYMAMEETQKQFSVSSLMNAYQMRTGTVSMGVLMQKMMTHCYFLTCSSRCIDSAKLQRLCEDFLGHVS